MGSAEVFWAGVFAEVTILKFTGDYGPLLPGAQIGETHRLRLWKRGRLKRTTAAGSLRCTPFGLPILQVLPFRVRRHLLNQPASYLFMAPW